MERIGNYESKCVFTKVGINRPVIQTESREMEDEMNGIPINVNFSFDLRSLVTQSVFESSYPGSRISY